MDQLTGSAFAIATSLISVVIALGAMLFQAMAAKYQGMSARDTANALTVSHLFKITSDYDDLSRLIAASRDDTERAININKTLNFLNSIALLLEKGLISPTIVPEIENLLLDALAVAAVTRIFTQQIARAVQVDDSSFAQLRRFESRNAPRIENRRRIIERMISAPASGAA